MNRFYLRGLKSCFRGKSATGMIEKLIENWLINVHELGYTIPFCEVLIARGYTIVRISRQGRGELGKDVIARSPNGELHTFQLKGPADINLPEWQRIQNEVRDLVQIPVIDPAVNRREPHVPFLVTNGEIVGDALTSIEEYVNDWVRRDYPRLQIIPGSTPADTFVVYVGPFNTLAEAQNRCATPPSLGTQCRAVVPSPPA